MLPSTRDTYNSTDDLISQCISLYIDSMISFPVQCAEPPGAAATGLMSTHPTRSHAVGCGYMAAAARSFIWALLWVIVYLSLNNINTIGHVALVAIIGTTLLVPCLNSLWCGDAIWCHRSWPTLVQVMVCCLMPPSHYLNHCWPIISEVLWHSQEIFKICHITFSRFQTELNEVLANGRKHYCCNYMYDLILQAYALFSLTCWVMENMATRL